MNSDGGRQLRSLALLVALTSAMLSFYLLAFYPGALSFDSAYQWWQARGHETTNIHGLGMTLLWRWSDAIGAGPGPLFLLQLALLWCGLLLIAASLPMPVAGRAVFLLAAGFAPVVFVLFTSAISDAVLAGLLCCVLGICVRAGERLGFPAFLLVLALLLLAILVRKNALLAVFPLVVLALRHLAPTVSFRRWLLAGAALCAVLYASGMLLDRAVDRRVTIFAATAMWDIAAVSIATGEILWPAATYDPGLTVDELRDAFAVYANTSVFANTRHGVTQPFFAPDDPLNGEISRAWIAAAWQHPRAYLAHRWQLVRGLLGSKDPAWPRELVYFRDNTQYGDNPPFAANSNRLHAWFMQRFDALRATAVFAAWPYLLLAAIAIFLAWHCRGSARADAALAAATSGLLYAAPLPVIAPSAELRYLGWTCLSAVLAAALAIAARRAGAAQTASSRQKEQ